MTVGHSPPRPFDMLRANGTQSLPPNRVPQPLAEIVWDLPQPLPEPGIRPIRHSVGSLQHQLDAAHEIVDMDVLSFYPTVRRTIEAVPQGEGNAGGPIPVKGKGTGLAGTSIGAAR